MIVEFQKSCFESSRTTPSQSTVKTYYVLADSRPNIRSQAIEKILDTRKKFRARDFRKFIKPSNNNFQANDYNELIGKDNWLVSILTDEYSSEYLESVLDSSEPFSFPKFPCHTQSAERRIRLVSETCSMIADQKLRDSRINITLAERESLCLNLLYVKILICHNVNGRRSCSDNIIILYFILLFFNNKYF